MKKRTLTIIIPVFNEEDTVQRVLHVVNRVHLASWQKEIIIINDGSTDRTAQIIKELLPKLKNVHLITLDKNQGKGSAVIRGLREANGDYVLIQDADLEYDPSQIPLLLLPIQEKRAEVVFGTRLKRLPNLRRDERTFRFLAHYLGNRALSFLLSILYKQWITDIETGYKVFPKKAISGLSLSARGFEFEPEITIQLIKRGYKIYEIPIRTLPRGYDQGKKLRTVPDGFKALTMIFRKL